MSKQKRVGEEKEKVGKAGSPSSATKNEKRRNPRDKKQSMPKLSKSDVDGGKQGRTLH